MRLYRTRPSVVVEVEFHDDTPDTVYVRYPNGELEPVRRGQFASVFEPLIDLRS